LTGDPSNEYFSEGLAEESPEVREARMDTSKSLFKCVAKPVVSVLLLTIWAITAATAAEPRFNPPKKYYLALGDSLAFGFQLVKFNANFPAEPPAIFSTGYVDDLSIRLQSIQPDIQTVNLGCTGETSATFINGGCSYTAQGFQLHETYSGPQLSAALAFLQAHRGQVSPITINIGINDVIALRQVCGPDISCYFQRAPAVLSQAQTNLNQILGALRDAAPDAEIITFTSYDVSFLFDPRLLQLTEAFNAVVASTAVANSVRVADVFGVFNNAPQPVAICTLTFICTPLQDSHPTDVGYYVIAQQIWMASDYDKFKPRN
jgi:lysophospholipase L1-like esterase